MISEHELIDLAIALIAALPIAVFVGWVIWTIESTGRTDK